MLIMIKVSLLVLSARIKIGKANLMLRFKLVRLVKKQNCSSPLNCGDFFKMAQKNAEDTFVHVFSCW